MSERVRSVLFFLITAVLTGACSSYPRRTGGLPATPTPTPRGTGRTGAYCLDPGDLDRIRSGPVAFRCDKTLPDPGCDPACDGLPVPPDDPACTGTCPRHVVENDVPWVLAAEDVEVARIYLHREKQLILQEFCNGIRYYTWKCHPSSQPEWGSIYAYSMWKLHDGDPNRDLQNGDHFDVYLRKDTPDDARFVCRAAGQPLAALVSGVRTSAAGAPLGRTTIVVTVDDDILEAKWEYEGLADPLDLEDAPTRQKKNTLDLTAGTTTLSFDVFVNLLKPFSPDANSHLYLVAKDLIPDTGGVADPVAYHRYAIIKVTRPDSGQQGLQLGTFNPFPPANPWFNYYLPESKPAIYLYSPKQQSVDLKISPRGQITTSLPTYPLGGWRGLETNSNGSITYLNQTYPYLYYEANTVGYTKPTQGWVIQRGGFASFMKEILPQLGLQGREIDDFINYWSSRIKFKPEPYLLVSFINPAQIETVDPLFVFPKPKTTIRVRVYLKPLLTPLAASPIELVKPSQRQGFTLVEWGGILEDPD